MTFTHQAAAAVAVGTYSPWEPTARLRKGSAMQGTSAPTEGGERRGHIVAAAHTACFDCVAYCVYFLCVDCLSCCWWFSLVFSTCQVID